MTINNPNIIPKPIVSATGTLSSANQIQTSDDSNVQTHIDTINTNVSNISRIGANWQYETATSNNPSENFFRLNNTNFDLATVIYLDKVSLSGRFDEFLTQFASGSFIFLQDTTNPGNSYLYETTADVNDQGGTDGWFEFTVTFRRKLGTFSAVANDQFHFIFLPKAVEGQGSASLPNMFLSELTEQDDNVYTRKIDTETTVRFWLRTALVQQSSINDAGVGLRVDESNGDLSSDGDTFESNTNVNNAYIYITVPTSFITSNPATNLWVVITENKGEADERIVYANNLDSSFTIAPGLSITLTNIYQSNDNFDGGGERINYHNNQTIELFFQDTERFFTIPEANEDNVDITRGVKNIAESRLNTDLQNKINRDIDLSRDDRLILNQFTEVSNTSVPGGLDGSETVYYRLNSYSNNSADYFTTTVTDGLPPNFGDNNVTYVFAIPHNYEITSIDNEGGVSATATLIHGNVQLEGAGDTVFNVYTATIASTGLSTNPIGFVGTDTTVTEIDTTDLIKIGYGNLNTDLRNRILGSGTPILSEGLMDFNSHISVAGIADVWTTAANPTSHRSTSITREFAAYWDENRLGATPFTGNYFNDLANPTITTNTGIDVTGAPLTNNYKKIIGFSHHINNENFSSTSVPLLKAGARRILSIDTDGLSVRQGNSDGTIAQITSRSRLFDSVNQDNSIQYLRGVGANSVDYLVPDTLSFPVTFDIQFRLVEGGSAGSPVELEYTVTDRSVSQAESSQSVSMALPGGGNRNETITTEYNATTNQLIIGTPGLSQNGTQDVTQIGMIVFHDVTQDINTSSTNTNVPFATQHEHRGDTVDILLAIIASDATATTADRFLKIIAVVNGHTENTIDLNWRESDFDFSALQFGINDSFTNYYFSNANDPANLLFPGKNSYASNGEISIANIQVYTFDDSNDFAREPDHPDMLAFYNRRNEWLGLFRSASLNSRTYTVNGELTLVDRNGTSLNVTALLNSLPSWQSSQSFTASNTVSASTPTNTTLGDFSLMSVRWNTGQTDASASDNAHRRFATLFSISDIINTPNPNVISGGFGADNDSLVVTVNAGDTGDTGVDIELVNLDDSGSLPANSQITSVEFY